METLQNSKCVDTRLGGHPLWYTFVRDDIDMRVPDEFKDCVVFVGRQQKYRNQLHFQAVGTGFLVALGDSPAASPYLVTARHVAEDCRSKFFIRTNTTEGKYPFIASETNPKWYFHPTEENVDVAVYPWVPPEDTSRKFIPEQMFLTDEMIKKKNIGIGDDLIVVGLFSQHEGRTRNEPIIRTGNIAMLPTEKIAVRGYGEIDTYLVEARSLGGMSGCPVFVRQSIPADSSNWQHFNFLLGLMHGHWDVPVKANRDAVMVRNDKGGSINMGIAVVVPSKKIMEVLNQPSLLAMRRTQDSGSKITLDLK